MTYIGRFAPSPTGPLHQGSLIAALASWLDAKSQGGQWRVRIEDLDPPRQPAGTDTLILDTLEAHGLNWDGNVRYQSHQSTCYLEIIDQLLTEQKAFYCQCSRKELVINQGIHQGKCQINKDTPKAVRLQVPDFVVGFEDAIQGHYQQNLLKEVGDFVIHRKDGLFAYQLAVVVDDYLQNITHIVRGVDIIDSTPRQIYLQQILDYPTPQYAHLPLLKNELGQKLSKQNHAPALNPKTIKHNLFDAMVSLELAPPTDLIGESIDAMLTWAIDQWDIQKVPSAIDEPWTTSL